MGVSHTLFRRFFWADNVLWKEDIHGHCVTVVLAGRDIVVNTKVIRAYLTGSEDEALETGSSEDEEAWKGNGLDVLWFPNLDHGQVFDDKRARSKLVQTVRRFCSQ